MSTFLRTVMESIYVKGRDNARTPMQWDASEHAGFTTGTPWIKVNPNYPNINAQQAIADSNSIFHYYRQLISLRKQHDILVYGGSYRLLMEEDENIYAYTREYEGKTLLVVLNFSGHTPAFTLPNIVSYKEKQLLISNYRIEDNAPIEHIELKPYEARAYILK